MGLWALKRCVRKFRDFARFQAVRDGGREHRACIHREEHNELADGRERYFTMIIELASASISGKQRCEGKVVELEVDATEMGHELREVNHFFSFADPAPLAPLVPWHATLRSRKYNRMTDVQQT